MKTFRQKTILLVFVICLVCLHISSCHAQLLYKEGENSLLQINQPMQLDLAIASGAQFKAKVEFPVSLMLINASGTQQIALNQGPGELFCEFCEKLLSGDFQGIGSDSVQLLRLSGEKIMPEHWFAAFTLALAIFYWLLAFFLENKITACGRLIAGGPVKALASGLVVAIALSAAIFLFFYSIAGILPGVLLLFFLLVLLLISPAVAIAAACELLFPRSAGLKKWLLVALLSCLAAATMWVKYVWLLFLLVALALTASTFRNLYKDGYLGGN